MATTKFPILFTGINLPILKAVGMGPARSAVTVTDDHVHVKMGWGFNGTIPRSQIKAAVRARKPKLAGWGVHGWGGKWTVNGSNDGIVKLTIEPRVMVRMLVFAITVRELHISLEDPDEFLAAIT
jgi:hypothetical protein